MSVPTGLGDGRDSQPSWGSWCLEQSPGLVVMAACPAPSAAALLFDVGNWVPGFTFPLCDKRFYGVFQLKTSLTFCLANGDADRGQEWMWKVL